MNQTLHYCNFRDLFFVPRHMFVLGGHPERDVSLSLLLKQFPPRSLCSSEHYAVPFSELYADRGVAN